MYDAGGVRLAIIDVYRQHGYKRVNIVAMEAGFWLRARRILSRLDYRSIVDYYSRNGLTVPSCYRKMHWNTCLALGSRDLCEFIRGRRKPISVARYEHYKWTVIILQSKIIRLIPVVLEQGVSIHTLTADVCKPLYSSTLTTAS